jgi:hypothetical protein
MIVVRGLAMEFHQRNAVVEGREWLHETQLTTFDLTLLGHVWDGRSTKAIAALRGGSGCWDTELASISGALRV